MKVYESVKNIGITAFVLFLIAAVMVVSIAAFGAAVENGESSMSFNLPGILLSVGICAVVSWVMYTMIFE